MKVLIVVDMQNDFIDGSLGSEDAKAIVPNVISKIENCDKNTIILATKDTHTERYLETQEGKYLPVPHCIKDADGWEINKDIDKAIKNHYEKSPLLASHIVSPVVLKNTFGSFDLIGKLLKFECRIDSIEIIGLCSEICVISNALLLKATYPEIPMIVDASCCAGVTKEKHKNAMDVMASCQVIIENMEV